MQKRSIYTAYACRLQNEQAGRSTMPRSYNGVARLLRVWVCVFLKVKVILFLNTLIMAKIFVSQGFKYDEIKCDLSKYDKMHILVFNILHF